MLPIVPWYSNKDFYHLDLTGRTSMPEVIKQQSGKNGHPVNKCKKYAAKSNLEISFLCNYSKRLNWLLVRCIGGIIFTKTFIGIRCDKNCHTKNIS